MGNTLDELPLSDREKEAIRGLGVESPAALMGMIQANPEAFEKFLGEEKTHEVIDKINEMLSDDELLSSMQGVQHFSLGAITDYSENGLRKPNYSVSKRDSLFSEIQKLQSSGDTSPATLRRIDELKKQINDMFERDRI